MGGRRESDTALLHGLSQCDSQCGSLDASIARQRRTFVCNTQGGRPQRPIMIAATCQVAEVPLITSLLLLLPGDLSDFARLSLTALFVGNWSRIYKPALIYRVLLMSS